MTVYGFRVAHGIAIVHHSLKTKAPRKCGAPPHCAYHERHAANKSFMRKGDSETSSKSTQRGSNPLSPASHQGLSVTFSGIRRSADIPEGYRLIGGSLARKIRHFRPKGGFSRRSLCSVNFQYPKLDVASPETGCVLAETGSNIARSSRRGCRIVPA
jgi:hypothetical protein